MQEHGHAPGDLRRRCASDERLRRDFMAGEETDGQAHSRCTQGPSPGDTTLRAASTCPHRITRLTGCSEEEKTREMQPNAGTVGVPLWDRHL